VPPGRRRPPKFAFKISKKLWDKRWSPFGLLRKGPTCFAKMMLNRYAKKRIGGALKEEEMMDYKDYLLFTLCRPASTEYALYACFDHYTFAKLPLDDDTRLRSLPIPVSFFYGDRDWMTFVGTHDVLSTSPYKGSHSHWYTIEDSDHHLYFDNPEKFVEAILVDL
jgi:pimeloyl-ACP methyl ester carboxylesterase